MRLAARMQKKVWEVLPSDERAEELAKSLKVSQILAQALINRGIFDSDAGGVFLRPKLTELIEPEAMPGMREAVVRIKKAIEGGEKITVYGDYDVDGITGVSILWQILELLGGKADYYIPHRLDEGYGLNIEAVEMLAKGGTNLIVTVDCGIGAIESAKVAAKHGVDLVISDHHQLNKSELPKAAAIVHPLLDKNYPNGASAGAMVAFKLAWAVANEFSKGKLSPELRDFMLGATSLAAMGTVADVVDMRGENRVLTHYGLKALADSNLCGVKALIDSAGLTGNGLDSVDIGFRLAPLLNAAGRMGHARLAVELLTSDSDMRSMKIAEYLKEQNRLRQLCERKILKQACEMISHKGLDHPDRKTIVLSHEKWHSGVTGIVASRIIDKYYRPAIMLKADNGIAQGSARSIPGFDILGAITACSEHLISFGGHKMAAGLKIETKKIDDFVKAFEKYAAENLCDEDVVAKLYIDSVEPVGRFNVNAVNELKMLEPFGQGNKKPVFASKGVHLIASPRRVGAKNEHLQVAIADNTGSVRCIGFRMGHLEKKLLENEFFDVAYEAQIDTYNGGNSVQFVLTDIQFE